MAGLWLPDWGNPTEGILPVWAGNNNVIRLGLRGICFVGLGIPTRSGKNKLNFVKEL